MFLKIFAPIGVIVAVGIVIVKLAYLTFKDNIN